VQVLKKSLWPFLQPLKRVTPKRSRLLVRNCLFNKESRELNGYVVPSTMTQKVVVLPVTESKGGL
jgi:hypothetical protein